MESTQEILSSTEGAVFERYWGRGQAALMPAPNFQWLVSFIGNGKYRNHWFPSPELAEQYISEIAKSFSPVYLSKTLAANLAVVKREVRKFDGESN